MISTLTDIATVVLVAFGFAALVAFFIAIVVGSASAVVTMIRETKWK